MLLRLLDAPHWEIGSLRVDLPNTLLGWLATYLALQSDWVGRERVSVLIWPDDTKEYAQHNLRVNLHRLRSMLKSQGVPAIVEADVRRLRLRVDTDVDQFVQAMARGEWALAVETYRQPLLADASLPGFPVLNEWAETERASLRDQWKDACMKRSAQLVQAREFTAAANLLERVLQTDPLAEDVVQDLLRCQMGAGWTERAREEYRRFERRLRDDLDVAPLKATADIVSAQRSLPDAKVGARGSVPAVSLVGRQRELQLLAESEARIAIVEGAAGVGKTCLVDAAFPKATRLRCREGMESVPYYALAQYLRQRDQASAQTVPGEAVWKILSSAPEAESFEGPSGTDAKVAKTLLFEAAAAALRSDGACLLIEDLQWADAATREFVVYLAQSDEMPLVITMRSEDRAEGLRRTIEALRSCASVVELRLAGLDVAGLQALATETLQFSAPVAVSEWLLRRTRGNALLASLTLRAMRDMPALQVVLRSPSESAWSNLMHEAERLVPAQVSELLRRPLAALSDDARRLVQALSVLQEAPTLAMAATVSGMSVEAIAVSWTEAEARLVLDGTGLAHDLLRQCVYDAIPTARRRMLHTRCAQALAGRGDLAQAAQHWFEAGDPDRAADYWFKRARQLERESLASEAADLYAKVVENTRGELRQHEAGVRRAGALCLLGQFGQAERELLAIFPKLVAQRTKVIALLTLSRARAGLGRIDEAWAVLQEARALFTAIEDTSLEFGLDEMEHVLLIRQGKTAQAFDRLRRYLDRADWRPAMGSQAQLWLSFSTWHIDEGRLEEGVDAARRALEIARAATDHSRFVYAAANILNALTQLRRAEEAYPTVEAALALGRCDGTDLLRANLARSYLLRGEPWRALPHADRLAREAAGTYIEGSGLCTLAESLWQLGRQADARNVLNRALQVLLQTDIALIRAQIILSVVTCGDDAQLAQALAFVPSLAGSQLPPVTLASLRKRFSERGIPLPSEFDSATG